jgi:formylglycine-generating enzyme required for sulfatase activity
MGNRTLSIHPIWILLLLPFPMAWAQDATQIRKLGIKCQNGEQSACAQLAKIAKTDKHPELRRLAVLKLTDQTVLAGIAKTDEYWAARQAATERITDQAVLTDIAKTDAEFKVRQAAISKLADKKVIGGIAKTDQDSRVRQAAVARLTEQALLAEIAKTDVDAEVRRAAILRLTDAKVLADVARTAGNPDARKAAVWKVTDQSLLAEIAKDDKDSEVRQAATEQLPDPAVAAAVTNSMGMTFVWVKAGSFQMGLANDTTKTAPLHKVTLSRGYYLQTTEVTQRQWEAVMGSNPSRFKGADLPVETVSWWDVQEFLSRLNEKDKRIYYRLPTEAEWEYACRAGGHELDEPPNPDEVAWSPRNSANQTHPVGQKQANLWGFFDMLGNVAEWCQDWFDAVGGPEQDPTGPAQQSWQGPYRVLRGGSWIYNSVTPWSRQGRVFQLKSNDIGFRCAGSNRVAAGNR